MDYPFGNLYVDLLISANHNSSWLNEWITSLNQLKEVWTNTVFMGWQVWRATATDERARPGIESYSSGVPVGRTNHWFMAHCTYFHGGHNWKSTCVLVYLCIERTSVCNSMLWSLLLFIDHWWRILRPTVDTTSSLCSKNAPSSGSDRTTVWRRLVKVGN